MNAKTQPTSPSIPSPTLFSHDGDAEVRHINTLANPRRNHANQDSGPQAREGREQNNFLEIRDAVLVPVEGCDEGIFRWAVEVAELCVYESFHPCGDLVDPFLQAFVSAIGSEYEGFVVQARIDVNVCVGGGFFPFRTLTFLLPRSSWVCAILSIIQVQLVPLWIFNRRK